MITQAELKRELVELLKEYYKADYKYYGIEVTEGYQKPSFFTQLIPINIMPETKNVSDATYGFVITYFQEKISEVDALEKIAEIQKLFGMKVQVKDRFINVTDFDYGFTGEGGNILQITISLQFKQKIERIEEQEIATEVVFEQRLEE